MKYSSAQLGRVLVIRLEDGDVVHECIEEAARAEGIARATVILLGGAAAAVGSSRDPRTATPIRSCPWSASCTTCTRWPAPGRSSRRDPAGRCCTCTRPSAATTR